MARHKKTAPWEDLVEFIALMPWWAGVLLAVAAYLWLHGVAIEPLVVAPGSRHLPLRAVWKGLATAGQYILPLLFVVGAGVSFVGRRQRSRLVVDVARSDATDALDGMSWREFEMLVGEGFRLQGYQVAETGGAGADGGVDLVLRRPGTNGTEKYLVQCKQWRAFKVGVDVVRQLYGVMAARGAAGGFVVTSGRFTAEAVDFANGRNVILVDGPKLYRLIRQAQSAGTRLPVRPSATAPMGANATTAPVPPCPLCSQPMVRRTAERGSKAGSDFWGCAGYPTCRGTRPIGPGPE